MPRTKRNHPFPIAGSTVPAGTERTIAIPVSDTSSGTPVTLPLRVLNGSMPGPAIFVSAAIHGDEIIGTEIIRQLIKKISPKSLRGTVIFVPVVNVFGFLNHSRYLPDRRDLNRSFPGSPGGSLASQLAHIFHKHVIGTCELGIDIHSAAEHRYNLPQIRIAAGSEKLSDLAEAFGAPAIIESSLRPGSLRDIARKAGVDMLLLEAGEALRIDDISVRVGVSGVLRVMQKLGMLTSRRIAPATTLPARSSRTTWVRAAKGGICRLHCKSGDRVNKGDVVAIVADIFGDGEVHMLSPIDGIIIGHCNLPVVNQGDAICHIAEVKAFDTVGERMGAITDALLSDQILDEDEVI